MPDPEQFLRELFEAAVAAADPAKTLDTFLPERPEGRVLVVGGGKASAKMAQALEAAWGPCEGLVVVPYGSLLPTQGIELVEARHPVPDAAGEVAARRIMAMAEELGQGDMMLCLISGGGSALLGAPGEGLTLEDKQAVHKALLKSGAAIDEMNCLRKHLSAIKGGRLAAAAYPAKVVTLTISDVPGDDPSIIASGPTVADTTSVDDAKAIIARYGLDIPARVAAYLETEAAQTPAADHDVFAQAQTHMISTPLAALQAAKAKAEALMPEVNIVMLGDALEGEARELGRVMAGIARSVHEHNLPVAAPALLLSGGETTVTLRHGSPGLGGRNSEFLLAFSMHAPKGVSAIACDTDGIDGMGENAGVVWTPEMAAGAGGLDADDFLGRHDALAYFTAIDGVVTTGPTHTNVNDFRAIFVPARQE